MGQNRLPFPSPKHKVLHPRRIVREVIIKAGCFCEVKDFLQTKLKAWGTRENRRTNEENHTFPALIWDIICPSISSKGFATPFLLCMKTLGTEPEAMRAREKKGRSTSQEKISKDARGKCAQIPRGGQAFISTGKIMGNLRTWALKKFWSILED